MTEEEKKQQVERVLLYNKLTLDLLRELHDLRESRTTKTGLAKESGITRQQIAEYESASVIPSVRAMNQMLEPMGCQLKIARMDTGREPVLSEKSKDSEEYFSVGEVAQKTGVTRQTVYHWIKAGIIEPETRSGRTCVSSEAAWKLLRRLIGWYLAFHPEKQGEMNE